ncbi:hypothetical protein DE146DRAFT_347940 [Phaeosphaeria sp. MPI-PUGE-AT-0046c]|nr:hypothetical protein DE146DRAFT_347940 [Phaeosphaeria sp. MPI-PUGE-AT-0046c]
MSSMPLALVGSGHPPAHHSHGPILSTPKKRQRPSNHLTDENSDPVVGHVTLTGKFKCLNAKCHDVSFGRQADFRRHYEHNHAAKRMEYYCIVNGCQRSRKPSGRSKGRGFGAREDKMKEHFRTVHEQGKRRKTISTNDVFGKDGQSSIDEEDIQDVGKTKQESSNDTYEDYMTWSGGINYT